MDKSVTVTVPPILACLRKAAEHLGQELLLSPNGDEQNVFVQKYGGFIDDISKMGDGELKSIADADVGVVNRFLEANGFSIRLPASPPNSLNVASVLNILVEWTKAGIVTEVKTDKGVFPAAKLTTGVGFFSWKDHTVVSIETKPGFKVPPCRVWMTPVGDLVGGDIKEVLSTFTDMPPYAGGTESGYNGVIFPMVDYDSEVDLSWIEGLHVTPEWFVATAVQQTKFRMNERGARAKSGVGMNLTKGASPRPKQTFIIDKPFALWITRKGIRFPLFSGIFAEDVWKRPESLD